MSLSEDFELRYRFVPDRLVDPDDVAVFNYGEQVNRLNAVISSGRWNLNAQWDEVALFANRYYLNEVEYVERNLTVEGLPNVLPDAWGAYTNLEKVRAKYETPAVSLSLGDSYAAFGRGIALNLNRNVDIDVDTSIQGTKVVWRPGAWDVTVVAGQLNRQQVFQDNPNIGIFGDRRHTVGGVRVERFGLGPANLGVHGVVYNFVDEEGLKAGLDEVSNGIDVGVVGATAELISVLGVDWYAEGDVFSFGQDQPNVLFEEGGVTPEGPGYALYGSGAMYPGVFVVLVEGKRYYQAERVNATLTPEFYEAAIAPTLEYERAITEDSSATVNSNDVWGGRVRVDYSGGPQGVVPYLSAAVYRDYDLGSLHFNETPETIVHPVGGIEAIVGESAALINAGYRVDHRDGGQAGNDRQLHGDLSVKVPLVLGLHGEINVSSEWFRWGINPFQQSDYTETESGITLMRGSALALTWYTDYTTNPLVNSVGNLSDRIYGSAELQYKPSSRITMKVFGGAYKAGLRCSGGQCRQLPGFEGTRFAFTGSF